jgi:hypothetical protein
MSNASPRSKAHGCLSTLASVPLVARITSSPRQFTSSTTSYPCELAILFFRTEHWTTAVGKEDICGVERERGKHYGFSSGKPHSPIPPRPSCSINIQHPHPYDLVKRHSLHSSCVVGCEDRSWMLAQLGGLVCTQSSSGCELDSFSLCLSLLDFCSSLAYSRQHSHQQLTLGGMMPPSLWVSGWNGAGVE